MPFELSFDGLLKQPNKAFELTRRSSAQGRGVSARSSTPGRCAD